MDQRGRIKDLKRNSKLPFIQSDIKERKVKGVPHRIDEEIVKIIEQNFD